MALVANRTTPVEIISSEKARADDINLIQENIMDLQANTVPTNTTRTANTVLAGPSTGSPAAPTFRALVDADVPNHAYGKLTFSGLTTGHVWQATSAVTAGFAALAAASLPTATTAAQGAVRVGNDLAIGTTILNLNKGTSFPGSPASGDLYFRTDFRAWFIYDGSAWRQTTVGDFTGAFPSSPTTNLRAYRVDRGLEYFYDGTRWLTTTTFDVRMPYTVNTVTADNFPGMAPFPGLYLPYFTRIDIMCNVGATNTGANYWSFNFGAFGSAYATLTTAALTASTFDNRLTTSSFTQPVTIPNYVYIRATKVGTASDVTHWTIATYRYIG